MKKFIVSLALLGLFSVGTMAVINTGNDNPPTSSTTPATATDNNGGNRNDGYCHHRRGGCWRHCDNRENCPGRENCDRKDDCRTCRNANCTVEDCPRSGNQCGQCPQVCDGHHRHHGRHCR